MDDRELRDELEALDTRLEAARRALADARSRSFRDVVAKLQAKVDQATARRDELQAKIAGAGERIAKLEDDIGNVRASLEAYRAEIARLEPLGDPLGRAHGNGCLTALAVVALATVTWWLA